MKKLWLSFCLLCCTLLCRAQVDNFHFVNSADPTGTAITFLVYGDNTAPSLCATPYVTTAYATPYMISVPVYAASAAWTLAPFPAANSIAYVRIFYSGPMGLEYYDYDLCALTAAVVPVTFSGGTPFTLYVGGSTALNQGSIQITP